MATMKGNKIIGTKKKDTINWVNFYTYYRNLTVKAGAGNDLINFKKSTYKNKLYGEAGKDTIYGGKNKDSIYGGDGNDKLYGYNKNDLIKGGKGNDYIDGGKGNDKLYGESGKNTIKGGSGDDTIFGGKGNDSISASSGNDVIDLSKGGQNTVYGGSGNDTVTGSAVNDYIDGGSGNDVIDAKLGNDTIYGGSGDDKIWGGVGSDKIYGGAGKDTLYAGSENDYVDGGDGDDSINGYSGNNTLLGGVGNDTINGGSGSDYIDGGAGNDVIKGTSGNNTLLGGLGNDKITAGSGNDLIKGGRGNDSLYAGKGKATFAFNDGDGTDTIYSGTGTDTIELPAGTELATGALIKQGNNLVIKYNDTDSIVLNNYFAGNHSVKYYKIGSDEAKLLADEFIYTQGSGTINGTIFRDSIDGSTSADVITAGSDRGGHWDVVTPGKDSDTVNVESNGQIFIKFNNGDGNDVVTGAGSAQKVTLAIEAGVVYGSQEGNDYVITKENGGITETITLKDFNFDTSKDKVVISNIDGSNERPLEQIDSPDGKKQKHTTDGKFETSADDTISYHVIGGSSADTITTGTGDDIIDADSGDNVITTSGGSNRITSGDGADIIKVTGGEGDNIISAGDGANDIEVAGKTTSVNTGNGNDKITVSGTESNEITSSGGSNEIVATAGSTTVNLTGTSGNNNVSITGGDNSVNTVNSASRGNDTITINGSGENHVSLVGGANEVNMNSTGSSTINGGAGSDEINITAGSNTVTSGGGADYISISGGVNSVDIAGSTDAIVVATGGTNTIDGSSNSRNSYRLQSGENTLNMKSGSVDTVRISGGTNTVNGTDAADSFATNSSITGGNNTFNMGAGDDEITISGGNSVVDLGTGNDAVYINSTSSSTPQYADITAGEGSDIVSLSKFVQETLYFKKGDGADRVINGNISAGEDEPTVFDTLVFEDSNLADLSITIDGNNNLIISYNDGQDQVTVENYVRNTVTTIKTLDNQDGVDIETLIGGYKTVTLEPQGEDIGANYTGTGLNESIIGTTLGDTIDGGLGNDIIRGREGADVLSDSVGNNIIYGGQGDDTINAYSTNGGNTIVFNRNDGVDKITNVDIGNPVTLKFEVESFNDLRFEIETTSQEDFDPETNFVIYYSDSDKVQLGSGPISHTSDYYGYLSNINIEVNGETKTLIQELADRHYIIDGSDERYSYSDALLYQGTDEDDVIYGNFSLGDILIGGKGDDTLKTGGLYTTTYQDEFEEEDSYNRYDKGPNYYVFDKSGDGNDVIYNSNITDSAAIVFTGVGANKDNTEVQTEFLASLIYEFDGDDLIIKYGNGEGETPSQIRIVNFKSTTDKSSIDRIQFFYPEASDTLFEDCLSQVYSFYDYMYVTAKVTEGVPFLGSDEYNQIIIGTDGDDTINPGGCQKIIKPIKGSDTIIIPDYDYGIDSMSFSYSIYMGTDDEPDTLWFEGGYDINDLSASIDDNDLFIVSEDGLCEIRLVDYFKNQDINNPKFMKLLIGGDTETTPQEYSLADIYTPDPIDNTDAQVSEVLGTVFNDSITLSADVAETVWGGTGNDTITASGGNDSIVGGRGNDVINLNNSGGNLVVIDEENVGFVETVENYTSTDAITFFTSCNSGFYQLSDLSCHKSSDDLVITTSDGGQVVIKNYFTSASQIDKIAFWDEAQEQFVEYSISNDLITEISDVTEFIGTDSDEEVHLVKGTVNQEQDVLHGNTYTSNATRQEYTVDAFALGYGGNDKIWGTSGNDWINGGDGNDTIYGNVGDAESHDMLSGHDGNNLIIAGLVNGDTYYLSNGSAEMYANAGDDTIIGGNGNDYIAAGAGSNTLTGNGGADTFALDGGNDVITDATALDRIGMAADFANMTFARGEGESTSLFINYGENGHLEIKNYFTIGQDGEYVMNYNAIRTFLLAGGSGINKYTLEWKRSGVNGDYSMYAVSTGSGEDDSISVVPGIKNWINPGGGNDTIDLASIGNNTVMFWDELSIGNNTVTGATSTDALAFVLDYDVHSHGLGGYKFSELTFTKSDNDLVISTPDSGTVTVTGFFTNASKIDKIIAFNEEGVKTEYSLHEDARLSISNVSDYVGTDYNEEIHLTNGDVNEVDDVLNGSGYTSNADGVYYAITAYANAGDGDDVIYGTNGGRDWINGGAGNDTIYQGSKYHDMISGGVDDDLIVGNSSNSHGSEFYGDAGNDTISVSHGNDFVWGGLGNDEIDLANGGSNKVMIAGESENYVETIKNATANDTLKFNYDTSGYRFSELSFEKSGDDLIVNTTTDNGQVVLKDFFTSTSKLDNVIALDDLGNIKDNYSIVNDAIINIKLFGGSTFNSENYNYNVTGSQGGDTYNILSLAKTTFITDAAGSDTLNISASKSDINIIFNVKKDGSFAEGDNKLILADDTAYNAWKTSGVLPTNGVIINGFSSIENINSSDSQLDVSLSQIKGDVAAWLNNNGGYADVATALTSGNDVSALIAIFEDAQNWR